jgi:DNA-binding response OmpR family regulator
MPRLDGETLARELELTSPRPATHHDERQSGTRTELLQRSLSRYLTKPVSAQHLLDAIGELTSHPARTTKSLDES